MYIIAVHSNIGLTAQCGNLAAKVGRATACCIHPVSSCSGSAMMTHDSSINITLLIIIRPVNGSPSATAIVLVVVSFSGFLLLSDLRSAKAFFSFHNQSSSNFAYRFVTTLFTIALCLIFKLSPN